MVARTVEALVPPTVPAGVVPDVAVVEAQAFLLEQARTFEPGQLNRLATHLRHRLDPDADDRLARDEKAQRAARTLTLATTVGGMVHVEGLLTPACGAALRTAIDAWSAPLPESDGTPDPRTAGQRRHDALGRLAEIAITTPGQLPTTHGSPYRIVVTVPHDTLTAAVDGQSDAGLAPAILPDGTALSSTTLASLTCDADLVPVLIDQLGNPLDVGDTQRLFPPKQRTAIAHRDQHCTYPGCPAPPPGATRTTSPRSAKAARPPSPTARSCAADTTATSTPPARPAASSTDRSAGTGREAPTTGRPAPPRSPRDPPARRPHPPMARALGQRVSRSATARRSSDGRAAGPARPRRLTRRSRLRTRRPCPTGAGPARARRRPGARRPAPPDSTGVTVCAPSGSSTSQPPAPSAPSAPPTPSAPP